MEMFFILILVKVALVYTFVQIYQAVPVSCVNFSILLSLRFNKALLKHK